MSKHKRRSVPSSSSSSSSSSSALSSPSSQKPGRGEGLTPKEKRKGHVRNPLKAWAKSGSKAEKKAIESRAIPPKHRRNGSKDGLVAAQERMAKKHHNG